MDNRFDPILVSLLLLLRQSVSTLGQSLNSTVTNEDEHEAWTVVFCLFLKWLTLVCIAVDDVGSDKI